jgi:hypothetical protein
MKRLILFFLVYVLSLSAAAQSGATKVSLEIKGVFVDKPTNCEQLNALEKRVGTFAASCESGYTKGFYKEVSFFEGVSGMTFYQNDDKVLVSINVQNFNYDKALTSLTAKFGPPKTVEEKIQNKMGAQFIKTNSIWMNNGQTLLLANHCAKLDSPCLSLSGREFKKHMQNINKPSDNL